MTTNHTPPSRFLKYEKFGAYHWRQYEQHTKYRRHADRVVSWIEESLVLDIGAGDGKITSLLCAAGKLAVGIDDEPEAVKLARERGANVIEGDAYDLPYQNEFFEAALMADVLEHLERPTDALREARRVISGSLYISTPPKRSDGKLTDKYHYREWTPVELIALVEQVGFALVGEITSIPEEKVMYGRFRKV